MIYPEPRYLPGGDRYILVEFGNEMNLELNFMAQGLAAAIAEARIKGVIETAPCFASMLVHYEPELIGFDDLTSELAKLVAGLGPVRRLGAGKPSLVFPGGISRPVDARLRRRLHREDRAQDARPGIDGGAQRAARHG